MSAERRREFHEALLDADSFEDLPGKWQAAIAEAEQNRPNLRVVAITIDRYGHLFPGSEDEAAGLLDDQAVGQ